MGLVHVENPRVGDGRAKDVPRQISQYGIITMAVVLAEGDPLPLPDVSGDRGEDGRCRSLQGRAKLRGDLAGKDSDRHEELSPSRLPVLAIGGDAPARGEQEATGGR